MFNVPVVGTGLTGCLEYSHSVHLYLQDITLWASYCPHPKHFVKPSVSSTIPVMRLWLLNLL